MEVRSTPSGILALTGLTLLAVACSITPASGLTVKGVAPLRDAGGPQPLCASTQAVCDGGCVWIEDDAANCGACGHACLPFQACVSGSCQPRCAPPLLECAAVCVDVTADRAHCGKCGHECSSVTRCAAGGCRPCLPTFSVQQVGLEPRELAVIDLDGDGLVELATIRSGADAGSVLQVSSVEDGGLLGAVRSLALATDDLVLMASGDFDRDGTADLLAGRHLRWSAPDPALVVLWGLDGGAFSEAPVALPPSLDVASLVVADFNRDGSSDIAYADWNTATVQVLLGDAQRGFGVGSSLPLASSSTHRLDQLDVADFDGDGVVDLLATDALGNPALFVFRGSGQGTFTQTQRIELPGLHLWPIVRDLDGNGTSDVVAPRSDGTVEVLLSHAGYLISLPPLSFAINQPNGGVLVDLDRDGLLDLVLVTGRNASGNRVELTHGDGLGGFTSTGSVEVDSYPSAPVVFDANHDGWPELAMPCASGNVDVLLNTTGATCR